MEHGFFPQTSGLFSVLDLISTFTLLPEGLRYHNFIIPRPMKKSKGNMNENAGKSRENTIFPADFLPGACRDESSRRHGSGPFVYC